LVRLKYNVKLVRGIALARVGNRLHGAFGVVERQKALF